MYCLIATVSHSSVDPTEWNGVQCTRGGDIQAKELTGVTSGPRWALYLQASYNAYLTLYSATSLHRLAGVQLATEKDA